MISGGSFHGQIPGLCDITFGLPLPTSPSLIQTLLSPSRISLTPLSGFPSIQLRCPPAAAMTSECDSDPITGLVKTTQLLHGIYHQASSLQVTRELCVSWSWLACPPGLLPPSAPSPLRSALCALLPQGLCTALLLPDLFCLLPGFDILAPCCSSLPGPPGPTMSHSVLLYQHLFLPLKLSGSGSVFWLSISHPLQEASALGEEGMVCSVHCYVLEHCMSGCLHGLGARLGVGAQEPCACGQVTSPG